MYGHDSADDQLAIAVATHGDWELVTPAGEIDLVSAPALDSALQALVGCDVLVRLNEVTFLDSSGLSVLAAAHFRAGDSGCRLAIVEPSPIVRRLIAITAFDSLIALFETLDDIEAPS